MTKRADEQRTVAAKLNSLSDTLRFAREAHIDYILGDCEVFESEHVGAVFRTSNICVGEGAGHAATDAGR